MESVFDSREFNQNLFFPRADGQAPPKWAEELFVEVEPSLRVHARRFPNIEAQFSLLYFHGNGEIVSDYNELSKYFNALGSELTVCDYRGYGLSDGTPTLRDVLQDSHTLFRYLQENGRLLDRVCVMGRSLGSAPAIELCINHAEIDCCVIESGYSDPVPLVERRGLHIEATTPEEDALFNNSQKIKKVTCPLLIMHGEEDFLISADEARLNYEKAGSKHKTLEILEGVGHNDMMAAPDSAYFFTLKKFFDSVSWKGLT